MDGMVSPAKGGDLIDDRPDDHVFRVDRQIYLDEGLFESELKNIFEADWIFLCHESQVKKPGDYLFTVRKTAASKASSTPVRIAAQS